MHIVALAFGLKDLPLAVAQQRHVDRGRRANAVLDLAKGQTLGRERHIVTTVGADPKANFLPVRPVELHIDRHGSRAEEAKRIHVGHNGRVLTGGQLVFNGAGGHAAARDSHAGNVNCLAGLIRQAERMVESRPARNGAEISS